MPSGILKVTDIPKDKVPSVVADFEADIPTPTIFEIDQGEGLFWTVVATYPGFGKKVRCYSKQEDFD